jgi:hypothetical protein
MAISVIHLPTNIDLSNKQILLRPHMVYVGKAISNLQQSLLYKELPEKAYKSWLWAEIKTKSDIHQALVEIKQALISKLDITLVCSCLQNGNCPANTIKKAIGYLIEQDKLSTSQELSFEEFSKQLSINEDTLHDFYVWLENNQISTNKVAYPNTWLCYVSLNLQTI